ncbi:hypothetical protein QCA50_018260 [Cerrena zonata]|uniref:Secreted protein n=1 Tax=Cerrena zonata TaxID=2478898 RepID=A0AAW0FM60_9APHY
MLNVLLWTFTVCNLTILSANVYRVFGPQKETQHTWLDRDNPLYVPTGPINTVEMTFQESTRFGFDPQNDWRTLYTSHHGIGFIHLGPFHHRFLGSTHHALHCVRRMIDDFNAPDHVSNP